MAGDDDEEVERRSGLRSGQELNESFSPTSRSARGSFHVEVLDEE